MTTATVDDHKRIRLPSAKPGQVFAVEEDAGRLILTPVTKAEAKVVFAKLSEDGRTFVLPDGKPIPTEGIADAVREEREAEAGRANRP